MNFFKYFHVHYYLTLQMRIFRHGEVKQLGQGHDDTISVNR